MKNTVFWQRLEGLVLLAVALMAYQFEGLNWWWFAFGLLLPDISMVGYLANNKLGALIYNLGHSLVLPLIITAFGYLYAPKGILALGLIWIAHVGMDRMLGFGLKDERGFKSTHLGTIGQTVK